MCTYWEFPMKLHFFVTWEVTGGLNEVKSEKCTWRPNFIILYYIIEQQNLWHVESIIHKSSSKITGGKKTNLKYLARDSICGIHAHMISLTNICYDFFTEKVIRGQNKVKRGHWGSIRRSHLKIHKKRLLLWYPWPTWAMTFLQKQKH